MLERSGDSDMDCNEWSRRRIVQLAAATGGLPLFGSASGKSATNPCKNDPPTLYPIDGAASTDPSSPVYFTHIVEHKSQKRRLEEYESSGEPAILYHHTLQRELAENPGKSTFNLVVNTMGERTSMTRNDRYSRTLHGFKPKDEEVEQLAKFGDVTYVADLVSTKVCLRNVARENLPKIAHLPSIVQISRMPGPVIPNSIDVENVIGSSWDQFTSAHGNYNAYFVTLGVIGAGYDSSSYGEYASNYAEDIGFDPSLSKDFTEESDPFNVTNLNWGGHTTNVADTAAYMLKDGDTHSDLFVSLKIVSDETSLTDENVRQALQYATKNGIDVLNMSFGLNSWSNCPSDYCEELDSFTSGGGVPVAAVGNKDNDSKVEYPACSWLTVGVGGAHKKDSSGNAVAEADTEYADIAFHDPFVNETYCSWCYNSSGKDLDFSPEVYGVSQINTNANNSLSGTSFACPQVAAAATIDFADDGISSYSSAMNKFTQMHVYDVVNQDESSDPAEQGDLVEADYYF